jgi:hypothetical protein
VPRTLHLEDSRHIKSPKLLVLFWFYNRVLRKIFGPKGDKVTKDWRRLRNEKLHDLYSSPNIIGVIKSRRMIWAGHVTCMEERHRGFWWRNLRKKRPFGRSRRRWENDIKMDLQEVT